jgi:hypothetical protein
VHTRALLEQLIADLQAAISTPRLDAYRQSGGSHLDMVVNYFWNIELAAAIVPPLHACEVALRNAIHNAMTAAYGNEMWFFIEGALLPDELEDFVEAYRRVYKKPEPIAGRVVAQLMFGFWTAMLNRPYEQKIWNRDGYTPLYAAFPHALQSSGSRIPRVDIYDRVKQVNDFRNRVFHYEKIYEWNHKRGNANAVNIRQAAQDHADILELIGWMNPLLLQEIQAIDHFPQAWANRAQIEADLKARFGLL